MFEASSCAVGSDEDYESADDGNGEVSEKGSTQGDSGLKRALAKPEPSQLLVAMEKLENSNHQVHHSKPKKGRSRKCDNQCYAPLTLITSFWVEA